MNGQYNSVLARLLDFNPSIWYLHCICHCLHLSSSKTAEKLPASVFAFIKKVYKHFGKSPKRIAQFEDIMVQMDLKIKKVLKSGKTRWLSLEAAIKRILELWEPLKKYFEEAKIESLFQKFNDNSILVYLQFLSVFLEKINRINFYFQRESSEILSLRNQLYKTWINLSNHIFKPMVNNNDSALILDSKIKFELNFDEDLNNYLMDATEICSHFNMVFGSVIHLNKLQEDQRLQMSLDFQKFIIQILKGLKHYLPFDDIVLTKITTLDPENSNQEDWMSLARKFPTIIKLEEFHQFFDEVSNSMIFLT